MKPVELRKLDIDNDQIGLNAGKLLHDSTEVLNSMDFIRPLGEAVFDFRKKGGIILN